MKQVNVIDEKIARRKKFRLLLKAWEVFYNKKNRGDLNVGWQKIKKELGWTGKDEMEAYKEFSASMKQRYMQNINLVYKHDTL